MLEMRVVFLLGASFALGLVMIIEPLMSDRIPSGWRRRGLLGVRMALEMVAHVFCLWLATITAELKGSTAAIVMIVVVHVIEFAWAAAHIARVRARTKPANRTPPSVAIDAIGADGTEIHLVALQDEIIEPDTKLTATLQGRGE
jgi:uncharacterized protein YjeT (DUF2065 family)